MPDSKSLEALDKSFSLLIDGATEKGPKLVEWLYAQSADLVQQLLMWNFCSSAVKCLVGVVLIILPPIMLYKYAKKAYVYFDVTNLHGDDKAPYWFGAVLGSIATLMATQIPSWNCLINITWLQIWVAPKIYLLEYLQHLAR